MGLLKRLKDLPQEFDRELAERGGYNPSLAAEDLDGIRTFSVTPPHGMPAVQIQPVVVEAYEPPVFIDAEAEGWLDSTYVASNESEVSDGSNL